MTNVIPASRLAMAMAERDGAIFWPDCQSLFVYRTPLLHTWAGWLSEDEYFAAIRDDDTDFEFQEYILKAHRALRDEALQLARQLGWDGDMWESGLHIAGLPGPPRAYTHACILIAWNADDDTDGAVTFVASPYEMPWLKQRRKGKPNWIEADEP